MLGYRFQIGKLITFFSPIYFFVGGMKNKKPIMRHIYLRGMGLRNSYHYIFIIVSRCVCA